jgi:hypothetical protein
MVHFCVTTPKNNVIGLKMMTFAKLQAIIEINNVDTNENLKNLI